MKTFLYHFAIFTLILCSANSYALSKDSTNANVLIEQQKDFYLKHLEKCWDIVEARDTTIRNRDKIIKGLHDAFDKSQIEKGISNRLTKTFRDSLTDQKSITSKQTKRKIIWRKIAVVAIVIVVGETFYIYLKQTYDVTF
jgi:hypothetical protein